MLLLSFHELCMWCQVETCLEFSERQIFIQLFSQLFIWFSWDSWSRVITLEWFIMFVLTNFHGSIIHAPHSCHQYTLDHYEEAIRKREREKKKHSTDEWLTRMWKLEIFNKGRFNGTEMNCFFLKLTTQILAFKARFKEFMKLWWSIWISFGHICWENGLTRSHTKHRVTLLCSMHGAQGIYRDQREHSSNFYEVPLSRYSH